MNQKNDNGKEPRELFRLSVDTQIIFDRLCKAEIGEIVTYSELNKLIGRNTQAGNDAYSCLASARRKALHENKIVFDVIMNNGLKRLDDSGIIGRGGQRIQDHIRKSIRGGARILSCIQDYDGMVNADKVRHNSMLSIYGAMTMMLKDKSIKMIESKVEEKQDKLAANRLLELFMER